MVAQAGLCLALSETPEDTFCCVVAQLSKKLGDLRKVLSLWFYHTVMCQKDADGIANSVNPD